MAFYGPTFPNETHYEKLSTGRQRFGNRSANMFFVRPARHIAAPRRLKYIHDIKTGYIPYVEDSVYDHRPAQRYALQKGQDEEKSRTSTLGLYNSNDVWRQELMELAQRVKTSLNPSDDEAGNYSRQQYSSRTSRLQKYHKKRNTTSALSNFSEENEDNSPNRRLLNRRAKNENIRSKTCRGIRSPEKEKPENETTSNEENQDSGIWLIPILCHILQVDNIDEAQEWLMNANPTEKRLAMELISRTMQDMQSSDLETGVETSITNDSSSAMNNNPNNVYWPFKMWQRQEKQRQNSFRMVRSNSTNGFPPVNGDNNDMCERATSPLRLVTPGRRPATVNELLIPTETNTSERVVARQNNEKTSDCAFRRLSQNAFYDGSQNVPKRSASTVLVPQATERQSRRGYRVATSMSQYPESTNARLSPVARGKTPLI